MIIKQCNDMDGTHRQGSLSPSLTVEDITAAVGFGPNLDDDPHKVEYSWGFTVDGVKCGIWDYKGARWSTFGPAAILNRLFPGKVGI